MGIIELCALIIQQLADQLRGQRNAVAHATSANLPRADFRARIQEVKDIYRELQWDKTKLN